MNINTDGKTVLMDADFLIALYIDTDSNHVKAFNSYTQYDSFRVLNLTIYEVATVLSRLLSHNEAKLILGNIISDLKEIILYYHTVWESDIFELYNSQTSKNISFFDCTVLYLSQKFDFKIASFDKFYPKKLLIS